MEPLISICIPTYERPHYLKKLLDSIAVQTFREFEVIVTDNSDSDVTEQFVATYDGGFPLLYHRNRPQVAPTANWTVGMQYARGQWIKVIHDDDWLYGPESLAGFAEAAKGDVRVIYSGSVSHFEQSGEERPILITQEEFRRIAGNPYVLLADNRISVPSVVMFRQGEPILYDERYNWLTDIECYFRWFEAYGPQNVYIARPLVTVRMSGAQLTSWVARSPAIVFHDFLLTWQKHKGKGIDNILVYDVWWRMVRNFKVRSVEEIHRHTDLEVPDFLRKIVRFQRLIPQSALSVGVCSKLFMTISYILNR